MCVYIYIYECVYIYIYIYIYICLYLSGLNRGNPQSRVPSVGALRAQRSDLRTPPPMARPLPRQYRGEPRAPARLRQAFPLRCSQERALRRARARHRHRIAAASLTARQARSGARRGESPRAGKATGREYRRGRWGWRRRRGRGVGHGTRRLR